jgi:hypothetical protein
VKSVRQVPIADHLWEALERMAEEMGTERDALVNQALHVFARLNGYLVPGAAAEKVAPPEREDRRAVQEQVLAAAARLERDMRAPPPVRAPPPTAPVAAAVQPPEPKVPPRAPAADAALVLVREDGAEVPVAKERFVIGRGRHCDLVVDSAKVSREHAALVREPGGWTIEDLGSSNGTWFRRERISRRRVEDGDEYFVSAERVRCVLR